MKFSEELYRSFVSGFIGVVCSIVLENIAGSLNKILLTVASGSLSVLLLNLILEIQELSDLFEFLSNITIPKRVLLSIVSFLGSMLIFYPETSIKLFLIIYVPSVILESLLS